MAEEPYVIDWEVVAGNVAQTLANLTAVRAQISANPKPRYSVHGHSYDWPDLYRYLGREIDHCITQLARLQPFEIVSMGR